MVTVVPVMPDAAGEARKAIVAATSRAVTGRPRADARRQRSTPSGHACSRPSRPTSPGRDRHHPDAARPSSDGRGGGEVVQRRLGHGIRGVGGRGPQPLDGPDDHDDPAFAEAGGGPVQQGRRGAQAGAVEGVPGRGVEGVPLEVVLREGVEHDDVGGAHRGGAAVEEVVARGIQRGGVGDVEVGVQRGGSAPGGLDVGDRGGGTAGVTRGSARRRRGRAPPAPVRRPGPARRWLR